jgi:hypothetical protein
MYAIVLIKNIKSALSVAVARLLNVFDHKFQRMATKLRRDFGFLKEARSRLAFF